VKFNAIPLLQCITKKTLQLAPIGRIVSSTGP
jgi:hypothetical protein